MSDQAPKFVLVRCACKCGNYGCASYQYPPSDEHGSTGMYNSGCRCDKCVAFHTATRDEETRRYQAETGPGDNYGKQWTGPELEVLMREDLTNLERAKLLGRSYRAVRTMRHKCLTEPKYMKLVGNGLSE